VQLPRQLGAPCMYNLSTCLCRDHNKFTWSRPCRFVMIHDTIPTNTLSSSMFVYFTGFNDAVFSTHSRILFPSLSARSLSNTLSPSPVSTLHVLHVIRLSTYGALSRRRAVEAMKPLSVDYSSPCSERIYEIAIPFGSPPRIRSEESRANHHPSNKNKVCVNSQAVKKYQLPHPATCCPERH